MEFKHVPIFLYSLIGDIIDSEKLSRQASSLGIFSVNDCLNRRKEIEHYAMNTSKKVYNVLHSLNLFLHTIVDKESCFTSTEEYDFIDLKIKRLKNDLKEFSFIDKINLEKDYKLKFWSLEEIVELVKSTNLEPNDKINLDLLLNFLCNNIDDVNLIKKSFKETIQLNDITDLSNVLKLKLEELKPIEKKVLTLRYVNKQTLQEIGTSFDLSRERIRQIESRSFFQLQIFIKSNIDKITKIIGDYYFSSGSIADIIYEQLIMLGMYKEFNSKFKGNSFIVKSQLYEHYLKDIIKIEDFVKNKKYIKLEDLKLQYVNNEFVKSYLRLFYNFNDGLIDKNISMTEAISQILKTSKRDINIKVKSDIEFVIKELNDKFDLKVKENSTEYIRNIERCLYDSCYIIAPKTFRHLDFISKIDKKIEDRIIDFIKQEKITNGKLVIAEFGGELRKLGYSTPHSIYSYLKHFKVKMFNFGGISLVISVKGLSSSLSELVRSYIINKSKPVSKDTLLEKFKVLNLNILNNLPINVDDFIFWGNSNIFLSSLVKVTDEDKIKIWKILNNSKISRAANIISEINKLNKLILEQNFVYNEDSLYFFLKYLFGDKVLKKQGYRIIYINN